VLLTSGAVAETPISPDSAFTLGLERSRTLWAAGQHEPAKALAESLVHAAEQRMGAESARTYDAREWLVDASLSVRNRPDPETCTLGERVLAYRERTALPDSTNMLRALQLAARCAHRSGDLVAALSRQERAIAIQERAPAPKFGPGSYDLSSLLNNYASMLNDAGRYAEMRGAMERALTIRLKLLPSDSPDVMRLRNNLGVALEAAGDYIGALDLYEQVLANYEKTLGPTHAKTGYALNNVANMLVATGDPARARELFERALVVREAGMGTTVNAYEVAETLSNLGDLSLRAGDATEAAVRYTRALAMQDSVLRADHPNRIVTMLGLASAHRSLGKYDEARRLALSAESTLARARDPNPADIARTLVSRGETEIRAGHAAAAVPPLERAVDILMGALGPNHPRTGNARRLLGEALLSQDDPRALSEALEAERIARDNLRHSFSALPERQALAMRTQVQGGLDVALAFLGSATAAPPDSSVAAAWDALVRSRGLVLDEMASRIHRISGTDTTISALALAYHTARQREVNLAVRGPRSESMSEYQARLAEAQQLAVEAEAALARASAPFRQHIARTQLGLTDVENALPRDAALAAYVRFESAAGGAEYAAFVLGSDRKAPAFVPLGSARVIDSLVTRWRKAGRHSSLSPAEAEAAYRRIAATLRQRVWDPVTDRIGTARALYVVPDGALGLVNFDTFPVGDGAYLLERAPVIHYAMTEREIASDAHHAPGEGGLLLAIGGVNYEAGVDVRTVAAAHVPGETSTRGGGAESGSSDCSALSSLRFGALAQSQSEIDDVGALWTATGVGRSLRELTGQEATESAFRLLAPNARTIHLATHGFFLEGPCPLDDPLIRSGLAMAGANARLRHADPEEDGILTAAEIAELDLAGVDMVVVSGCETGVGAPADMEGLLGLRRAFQVAGEGTLVTSLWSVGDTPARHWIHAFYQARLSTSDDSAEAARAASRALLGTQRSHGRGGHPAAWGAFVSYGPR